jgi:hypothetical protein
MRTVLALMLLQFRSSHEVSPWFIAMSSRGSSDQSVSWGAGALYQLFIAYDYLKDLAIGMRSFSGFELIPKKVRKFHCGSIHVVVNIPPLEERYAKVSFHSAPFPKSSHSPWPTIQIAPGPEPNWSAPWITAVQFPSVLLSANWLWHDIEDGAEVAHRTTRISLSGRSIADRWESKSNLWGMGTGEVSVKRGGRTWAQDGLDTCGVEEGLYWINGSKNDSRPTICHDRRISPNNLCHLAAMSPYK